MLQQLLCKVTCQEHVFPSRVKVSFLDLALMQAESNNSMKSLPAHYKYFHKVLGLERVLANLCVKIMSHAPRTTLSQIEKYGCPVKELKTNLVHFMSLAAI